MGEPSSVVGPVTVAIIAATVPSLIALWQARDKARLDERTRYYADIRADLDDQRERLRAVEGYMLALEEHVSLLHSMMISEGHQPPPKPERPKLASR